jgi:hypothetical protein
VQPFKATVESRVMGLLGGRGLSTAVQPLKATTGSREGWVFGGHWDGGDAGVARAEGDLEEGPSEIVGTTESLEQ